MIKVISYIVIALSYVKANILCREILYPSASNGNKLGLSLVQILLIQEATYATASVL